MVDVGRLLAGARSAESVSELTAYTALEEFRSGTTTIHPMKYEYWKSKANNQWYWHLKAANGEKIAASEGYTGKGNCLAAIKLLKSSVGASEVNLTPDQS